jgi:hypothetical protein
MAWTRKIFPFLKCIDEQQQHILTLNKIVGLLQADSKDMQSQIEILKKDLAYAAKEITYLHTVEKVRTKEQTCNYMLD